MMVLLDVWVACLAIVVHLFDIAPEMDFGD
jgi:hypothetical protein